MKRFPSIILCLLILVCTVCYGIKSYPNTIYTELGIPRKNDYAVGNVARCPWDIEVFSNRLFIGGGDSEANAGPVKMYFYDIEKGEWKCDSTLPDEEINRFYVTDTAVYAAGIDPRGGWELGNFYAFRDNLWMINRTIPNAIHNFDILEFDGKLFAALGAKNTDNLVMLSADNGQTWSKIPIDCDSKLANVGKTIIVRVYDLFVFKNKLYAHFIGYDGENTLNEIYAYQNGKFVFHSSLPDSIEFDKNGRRIFNQKKEFCGKEFFVTNSLYVTSDMVTADKIFLGENVVASDLQLINGSLYVLCNEQKYDKNSNTYFTVSVWKTDTGENDSFSEILNFDYENRALSFAYNEDVFYFGIGGGTSDTAHSTDGMILSVKNDA